MSARLSSNGVRVLCIVLNDFRNDSRVLKECLSLQAAGYQPQVVALHEPGLPESEQQQGISVHRIALKTRSWSKHRAVHLLKYAELFLRVLWRYRGYAIVHCHDLDALPMGVGLKLLSPGRTRLVYDAHEYESHQRPGQSAKVTWLLQRLEGGLIRFADRVITVSASIAREYTRLYGIAEPAVVLNCPVYKAPPEQDKFREAFPIAPEQMIFLYQGGLGPGRGVEQILAAFEAMNGSDKVVVFMGYGPLADSIRAVAARCPRVFLHAAVSPAVLMEYTASADVGLCPIQDSCLSYHYCLPNKLFEYMMAGLPVIASNLPEMQALITREQVGWVLQDFSVTALQAAVEQLKPDDIAQRKTAVASVACRYNWAHQEPVLHAVYQGLTEKTAGA